jgi:hypothetical protein
LRWILLLEKKGTTFEYFPGNKHNDAFIDTTFFIRIDNLNIKEEEELLFLSKLVNGSISKIELSPQFKTL